MGLFTRLKNLTAPVLHAVLGRVGVLTGVKCQDDQRYDYGAIICLSCSKEY
jgi:hypothetical protein